MKNVTSVRTNWKTAGHGCSLWDDTRLNALQTIYKKEILIVKWFPEVAFVFEFFSLDSSSCIKALVTSGNFIDFLEAHRRYDTMGNSFF